MPENFVSYEQAVKLYNLDFDWDCEMVYYVHSWMKEPRLVHFTIAHKEQCNYDGTDVYPAPLLSQAQKWLREVKDIIVVVTPETDMADFNDIPKEFPTGEWCYEIWKNDYTHIYGMTSYPSYEQALSAGITAALELIEKK